VAAIAAVTRSLGTAEDHQIPGIIEERRAMREELAALRATLR
jgi:hypothetical protein